LRVSGDTFECITLYIDLYDVSRKSDVAVFGELLTFVQDLNLRFK